MSDNNENSFTLESWEATMPANYDLREVFQQTIKPLFEQLREACVAAGMPMLVTVATTQDDVGTGMESLQHFPGADRSPATMLIAMHALKLEWPQMMLVDEAAERRGIMIQQAMDAASAVPVGVTKH